MKIAIGQINPKVGDLSGNLKKIREAVRQAQENRDELLVLPELALIGYPPGDLLLRRGFVEAAEDAFAQVIKESAKVPLVVGHIARASPGPRNAAAPSFARWHPYFLHNAAFLLAGGRIVGYQGKRHLSSSDVFEEPRYFLPAKTCEVFELHGLRLALSVGEDFWYTDEVQAAAGVDLLINVSASPYVRGKPEIRFRLGQRWVSQAHVPLLYVNLVGAQDELVFDGRSFAVRPDGAFLLAAPPFTEGIFSFRLAGEPVSPPAETGLEDIHQALVLGIQDYCQKNGIGRAVVGISGGLDSAVVGALSVEALDKNRVLGAFLPGPYTAKLSWEGARALAENLGIRFLEIPITSAFEVLKETLAPAIPVDGLVAENLQARIRGVILMALANAAGAIVLCPANKAEIAMGYNTLYGDTVGALAPLGDLLKEDVSALARHLNAEAGRPRIPAEILARPPSAELRPGQKDEDDLPPYAVLDPCLRGLLEENLTKSELLQKFGAETVEEILRRFHRAEYKRRQLPLVLKVTPKAFGMGWRFPVTHGYRG
mgnify:FL=1